MKRRLLSALLACLLLACLPLGAAAEDVKPESIFANAKTIDEDAQVYDGVPYKDTIDYYANEYKLVLTHTADITVKYTSSIGQYMGMVLYREDGTMISNTQRTGYGLDYDTEGTPIYWEKYVLPQGTYALVFAADGKSPSFSFLVQGLGVKHVHDYQPKQVVPSTCTTQGYTEYACYCGLTQNRDITPPMGHNQVGGICSQCGTLPSGIRYQLDGLGRLTFTGDGVIGGYGQGEAPWYASREKIASVVFPAGITELGGNLFYGCDNLKNILFQGDAPELAADAFTGVSGTVHYRDTANGWNAIVPQGFGGLLGWDPNHTYETVEVPATCTEEGYTKNTCACGAEELTEQTPPKHDAVDRVCIECAQWGKCGEATTWLFDGVTGTLTVSGTGTILDDRSNWSQWKKKIHTVIIEDGVTNADYFSECKNLTSVSLADTVTTISGYAFNACSALPSITLPDGVTLIEDSAFQSCNSLTQIEIPQAVTAIGKAAFSGCISLKQVTIPGTLTCAENAFNGCQNLHVTVRPGSTAIGEKMLYKCTTLTSISIPDSVTSIGSYAFYGCTSIKEILIPDSVTNIGSYAFKGCTSLEDVLIPDSVTGIGSYAFNECTNLTGIHIPEGVTSLSAGIFEDCTALESIAIPDGVTAIGSSAFSGCSSLRSVKLPDALTEIGRNAFADCKKLKVLILPDSLTSIGYGTFDNCTSLPSIVIPASMTSIDGYAFDSCKMSAVYLKSEFETLNSLAFRNVKGTDVYYPAGTWSGRRNDYGGDLYWRTYTPCDAHSYTTWTVTAAATCEAYGMESSTCDVCGLLCRRYLEPLGHTMDAGVVTDPTCTQQGYTTYTCTTCSRTYRDTYTDPAGHIWDEGVITIPPTADTDGEKTVTCTVCGATKTQVVMNLNHTHEYGDWITAKAPTCTEAGLERQTCRCGEEETREVAALGHTEVTDPAEETSCTAPGKTEGKHCSACGQVLTPQTEIPMLPHTEVVSPAVEPTCLTPGKAEGIVCSVCNTVIQAPEEIPSDPAKHVMVGNVCRICGDTAETSFIAQGIWCVNTNWKLLADGTFVITGNGQMESDDRLTNRGTPWDDYKDQIKTVIVCQGLTNIASDAFSNCGNLTKTYIADSVKSIDMGAFYSCASLEAIEIPAGVTTISMDAYYGCNSVTEITVPETVVTIDDYAFCYCENLETITIPGTLKTVPYGLTIGCPKLATVNLAEGIETLTGGAFASCTALETVTIPASVKTVGDYSFSDSGLKEITFLGDAPAFGQGNNVFENVTANAYYPPDNATWTDAVKQNYGGTITWGQPCIGHVWDGGMVTSNPTEEAEGVRTFTCLRCGDEKTEAVAKLEPGHEHTDLVYSYSDTQHWEECACGSRLNIADHEISDEWATDIFDRITHYHRCPICSYETDYETHTDADADALCDVCGDAIHDGPGGYEDDLSWSIKDGVLTILCYGQPYERQEATEYPWYPHRDSIHSILCLNPIIGAKAFQGYPQLETATMFLALSVEPQAFADCDQTLKIVFYGPTPQFAEDSFLNTTAQAQYDELWDASVLQNYGGTITWSHAHAYQAEETLPTCTGKGFTTYTCVCGDTYTDNEVDPLGHSWDDGVVTKEPTEDAEGEKTITCTTCGEITTEAIPKLEQVHTHSFEGWEHDETQHWQVCSCGETTEKENHRADIPVCGQTLPCEVCGADTIWDRVHEDADEDGWCDVCKWETVVSAGGHLGDMTWGILEVSGRQCVAIMGSTMPDLTSPEEYPWYRYRDQIEVVGAWGSSIGAHAFQSYPQLTLVMLGSDTEPVSAIGAEAFADNPKLVFLQFENQAPEIAEDAFRNVTAIAEYDGTWDESLLQNYGGNLTWNVSDEDHTHTYTEAVTPPTCTEKGFTTYTCDCGETYTGNETEALGHSWNDGEVTREPTVDAVGVMTYTCTVCGATKTGTIPKLEDPDVIKPHSARARLIGDEALAYDALVPFLREIAAGTRTSTEIKIGEGDGIEADVHFTVKLEEFDCSAVYKALQIDFPYELYWNNYYTNATAMSYTSQRLVAVTFRFQVDAAYQGSKACTIDPGKLAPAQTALANAKAIAAKYADKSDYDKLRGYWQEIMELTEYADDRDIPEKDIRPWQLVSVFDGDPDTKVICEGYSKAFQYLCNLGGLVCYPVEGSVPGGDHQWNIVTLEGENYLMDVTNSEPGLIGHDGTLFLAGASGSVADGYTHVNAKGQATLYTYRDDNITLWGEEVLTLSNHDYTCTREYTSVITDPTCTEAGYTTHTCNCGHSYTDSETEALGHGWKNGICEICGAPEPKPEDIFRIAGDNRFDTAFRVADQMKKQLGVEKFDAIIVASGTNFADALSGSYLAAVKNAPILLSFNDKYNNMTKDYIRENLKPGGIVYILGGTAAVPAAMEKGLEGFVVRRLDGKDRFETNLSILLEAGVGDKPILVCTGLSFADSLSASASELPILLVWNNLTDMQKAFLKGLKGNDIYVIGGESAVGKSMEKQVSEFGTVQRIGGGNRFETSVAIAEAFFDSPETAVLAYAWNYPDGLCGGALAATMDVPLILTMAKYETAAKSYIQGKNIAKGIILGGDALIPESSIHTIFR